MPPLGAAFFVRVVSGFQIQDKRPDQHQHKPQRLTEINGAFEPHRAGIEPHQKIRAAPQQGGQQPPSTRPRDFLIVMRRGRYKLSSACVSQCWALMAR